MNLFKSIPAIFCTIIVLVACAGKGKKIDPMDKLQGTWEIKRAEGTMERMNVGTVYEFKGSKLTLRINDTVSPGSTEITDSTFSFQPDGNERKFIYHYKFKEDTLVASIDISDGQIFYLAKK